MMKKQMIFTAIIAGCLAHGLLSAESQNSKNVQNKNQKAFILNINGWSSVVENYDRENIPHTNTINGKHFGRWIKYWEDGMKTDNVSVVTQLEGGDFTDEKALDSFSRNELFKCEYEVAPFRTFEQSNGSCYGRSRDRSSYEPEHLDFIEQLQSDRCVLCMYGNDKQIIVAHAQGLPQQVCEKLERKRSADIDQAFKKNIHRSWRKVEQEKKEREAARK